MEAQLNGLEQPRDSNQGLQRGTQQGATGRQDTSERVQAAAVTGGRPVSSGEYKPIRAVIWHPDGSIDFGLDTARADELVAAAAVARGYESSGDEGRTGGGGGQDRPSEREDDVAFDLPGWRRVLQRQKVTFLIMIALDLIYLIVLLAFRLAYGRHKNGPDSPAVQFFIGNPSELEVPFLSVTIATDALAGMAGFKDYSPLLSLFVLWSIILTAFAVLSMPLLFLFLRVGLVVSAFQLRWTLARMRNVLPPNSVSEWFFSSGQAVVHGGQAVGRGAAALFGWAVRRRQPEADMEMAVAAPQQEQQQRQGQQQQLEWRLSGRESRRQSSGQESRSGQGEAIQAAPAPVPQLSSPGHNASRRPSSAESLGRAWSARDRGRSVPGVQVAVVGGRGGAASPRPGEAPSRRSRSQEGIGAPSERPQPEPVTLGELYLSLMRDLHGVQARSGTRNIAGAAASAQRTGPTGSRAGAEQIGGGAHDGGPGAGQVTPAAVAAEQRRRQREAMELWISRQFQHSARRDRRRRRRSSVPLLTVEPPG